jgi:hypothetical protein
MSDERNLENAAKALLELEDSDQSVCTKITYCERDNFTNPIFCKPGMKCPKYPEGCPDDVASS